MPPSADPRWRLAWRGGLTILLVVLVAVFAVDKATLWAGRPTPTERPTASLSTVIGSNPPTDRPATPAAPTPTPSLSDRGGATPSPGASSGPSSGPKTGPTARPTPSPTDPTPTPTPARTAGPGGPSLRLPIRAAFYYPWFAEAWHQQGYDPFSWYKPTLGYYATKAVAKRHVAAMQGAGIRAGIASWWGQGSATDGRIPALLAIAGTFRWTLYYEAEAYADPSVTRIRADLAYIGSRYATNPAYLRVAGKPVIFVYAGVADRCAMAERWEAANTVGFYVVLKVFPGFRTCARQPESWHQYAPAVASDRQAGYSYSISPGFWKRSEANARLARDPNRWARNVAAMKASGEPWQLITTFNEWGEGTGVEDTTQFGSTYLGILAGGPVPTAQPSTAPSATPATSATPAP